MCYVVCSLIDQVHEVDGDKTNLAGVGFCGLFNRTLHDMCGWLWNQLPTYEKFINNSKGIHIVDMLENRLMSVCVCVCVHIEVFSLMW